MSANSPVPDQATVEQCSELLGRVRASVAERIVGQEAVLDDVLTTFLARGHLLIEGVPGTAKTLLVRTLAALLGIRFSRIQFTPDLMPSDVTGVSIMRQAAQEFEFRPGPIFTDILLADEINRAPAKTQSALLEGMAERQVTVDGQSRSLGDLFTVFATQNPVEHEGTYPLPEAQLDRFLMKSVMAYPPADAERLMLTHHVEGFDPERAGSLPTPVLSTRDALSMRSVVDRVRVGAEVQGYIVAIARATREEAAITLGASPRATVALMRAARAAALLEGREYVTPDDVKSRIPAVLRHRVTLAPELEVEGRSVDDVLAMITARVPVPDQA